MYERDQFTMTIPEVASGENQDIPHIIQLRINEELCHCLVDTGAAVTLIPIGMVQRHNINTWDAGKYKLTSVTGHSLRTWGTAVISIGPEDGKWNINWTAIVCDNETLGNVRAILGRDFLHASQACISYGNEPFVKLKGEIFRFLCQEGPTCDSGYHDKNIGHITTSSVENSLRNVTKVISKNGKNGFKKIKSFFGSSRNGKPTEELQHTNDVNRQPNQEYGKDSAESIEGKIEEVVVTEIQTGTGKEDAGKRIEGKDSVPESVEQEIQDNKDLVEPSLEMISTEKQPRDPEEVFHDINSIDTTKSWLFQ
ncbi:hypothetical protein JTB14_008302 [Gonioctena quinquepunctata]|nr:hypothetical protein JTB14_008302 [Gonioctena quinquepunctata]